MSFTTFARIGAPIARALVAKVGPAGCGRAPLPVPAVAS